MRASAQTLPPPGRLGQIDEPVLVLDLIPNERHAFSSYIWRGSCGGAGIETDACHYFRALWATILDTALSLPVAGLHVDLVRARRERLEKVVLGARKDLVCRLALSTAATSGRPISPQMLDRIEPIRNFTRTNISKSHRRARCCTYRSTSISKRRSIPTSSPG